MGSPVPLERDGRVLFELFDDAYVLEQELREVSAARTEDDANDEATEESAELTRRLKALGYI